jgi:hypothetical protein
MFCLSRDLLLALLCLNPVKRITAAQVSVTSHSSRFKLISLDLYHSSVLQALQHPWFQERPLPKKSSEMPTFPSLAAGEKATTISADDFA